MPLPPPASTAPLTDWTNFWQSYNDNGASTYPGVQPMQAWNAEVANTPFFTGGPNDVAGFNTVFGLPG